MPWSDPSFPHLSPPGRNKETALKEEESAHRTTRDELQKARRELQLVKTAALQYRASQERGAERVRARLAEQSLAQLRTAVPSVRILRSAFPAVDSGRRENKERGILETQVEELEQKRAQLMDTNQALKRLATDAVNTLRTTNARLGNLIDDESGERHKLGSSSSSSGSPSSSSSASSSSLGRPRMMSSAGNGSSEDGVMAYQRELFPPLVPLRTNIMPGAHPGVAALDRAVERNHAQLDKLERLRTARANASTKKIASDRAARRESVWRAQLAGSLRAENSATVEEVARLSGRLADAAQRLARAEETLARRTEELKRSEEAETAARTLIENYLNNPRLMNAASGSVSGQSADADESADIPTHAEIEAERASLAAERERYIKLSRALDIERMEFERAKKAAKEAPYERELQTILGELPPTPQHLREMQWWDANEKVDAGPSTSKGGKEIHSQAGPSSAGATASSRRSARISSAAISAAITKAPMASPKSKPFPASPHYYPRGLRGPLVPTPLRLPKESAIPSRRSSSPQQSTPLRPQSRAVDAARQLDQSATSTLPGARSTGSPSASVSKPLSSTGEWEAEGANPELDAILSIGKSTATAHQEIGSASAPALSTADKGKDREEDVAMSDEVPSEGGRSQEMPSEGASSEEVQTSTRKTQKSREVTDQQEEGAERERGRTLPKQGKQQEEESAQSDTRSSRRSSTRLSQRPPESDGSATPSADTSTGSASSSSSRKRARDLSPPPAAERIPEAKAPSRESGSRARAPAGNARATRAVRPPSQVPTQKQDAQNPAFAPSKARADAPSAKRLRTTAPAPAAATSRTTRKPAATTAAASGTNAENTTKSNPAATPAPRSTRSAPLGNATNRTDPALGTSAGRGGGVIASTAASRAKAAAGKEAASTSSRAGTGAKGALSTAVAKGKGKEALERARAARRTSRGRP